MGRPVSASQKRTVLSNDAVTTLRPPGLKSANRTASPCWSGGLVGWPVCASQIRALWSSEAVTTRLASGLNVAQVTSLSCLSGAQRGSPVRLSQMRAVPSFEAVTTRWPSALKLAVRTEAPLGEAEGLNGFRWRRGAAVGRQKLRRVRALINRSATTRLVGC